MILTCKACGKEFEAKRSDAKTCSPTCRQQLKRGSFPTKNCLVCGKEFKGPSHSKYCSKSCQDWATELRTFRKNTNRYDYLDCVTLGDEENSID